MEIGRGGVRGCHGHQEGLFPSLRRDGGMGKMEATGCFFTGKYVLGRERENQAVGGIESAFYCGTDAWVKTWILKHSSGVLHSLLPASVPDTVPGVQYFPSLCCPDKEAGLGMKKREVGHNVRQDCSTSTRDFS